jgi:hypothetical protein
MREDDDLGKALAYINEHCTMPPIGKVEPDPDVPNQFRFIIGADAISGAVLSVSENKAKLVRYAEALKKNMRGELAYLFAPILKELEVERVLHQNSNTCNYTHQQEIERQREGALQAIEEAKRVLEDMKGLLPHCGHILMEKGRSDATHSD